MSNSKMVSYTKISPHSSNPRNHMIDKITIHHMAGNCSVETCGDIFADPKREASSNYGVGTDGRVAMYVEEKNRAWTSGNRENDHRAVTIEVANDGGAPQWHVSDKALEVTIALCVDICQRNGIAALNYTGDKSGNLTMHEWFQPTDCPGPYLKSKFPYIAQEVNKRLKQASAPTTPEKQEPVIYRVQSGAYKERPNTEKQLAALKAAGFSPYLAHEGGMYKVLVGAYTIKANAAHQLARVKAAGFDAVIVIKGSDTTAPKAEPTPQKKTNSEIADEVILGLWGNGAERKQRLTAAGYNPSTIQKLVNSKLR